MTKVLFAVSVLFLLVGLPVLALGGSQLLADRQVAAGRHTVGVVVNKVPRAGRPNQRSVNRGYFVIYRFTTPERMSVENEATMSQWAYNALSDGGPIDVVYLPEAPTRSRARGELSTVWVSLPIGAFFTAVGVICLALAIPQALSDRRLRRDGVLTEATVTEASPANMKINGIPQVRVGYQFSDERGERRQGRSPMMPEPDAAEWTAGRRVFVKYDRARPSNSLWIGPEPGDR
jgi:hypothetical protein